MVRSTPSDRPWATSKTMDPTKQPFIDPTPSKSCLTFRLFTPGRKKASQTESSSRASQNGVLESDLDVYNSAWESFNQKNDPFKSPESTAAMTWASSPQQQSSSFSKSNDSSNSARSGGLHLLTPPTPSDRSAKNRKQLERTQRRKGVYEGELEPEGIRGQEAVVVDPQDEQPSFQRRSFESPNRDSSLQVVSPSPPQNNAKSTISVERSEDSSSSSQDLAEMMQTDFADGEPLQFNAETGRAVRFGAGIQSAYEASQRPPRPPSKQSRRHQQQQQQQPQMRHTTRQQSSSESTNSDDEIRNMMPDLMPKMSFHEVPKPETLSPAARNAAEAAASWQNQTVGSRSPRETPEHVSSQDVNELNVRAMEFVHNGEYDHALETFELVLEIQKNKYGSIHPTVASAYHNLGTVHAKRSNVLLDDSFQQRHVRQQALECFQAAARTARDALGPTHPNVAVSLVRIGFLLLQSRQYHHAIITFKEALRVRLAHYGPQHGLVANLYNNLGVCHMHLGQFEPGRDFLDAALEIQRKIVVQEEQSAKRSEKWIHLLELADTLFNIGGLCLEWIRRQGPDARRAVDAEQAFAEALEIRTKVLGPKDPSVVQVKALLDMAKAVPRPRQRSVSPKRHQRGEIPQSGYRSANLSTSRGRSASPRSATMDTEDFSNPPGTERSVADIYGNHGDSDSNDLRRVSISSNQSNLAPSDESHEADLSVDRPRNLMSAQGDSIFRTDPRSRSADGSSNRPPPPVFEVSVSKEEDDEDDYQSPIDSSRNVGTGGTRIFMSPHLVPESSPSKRNRGPNDSNEVVSMHSFDEEPFEPDTSTESLSEVGKGTIHKAYSYDAEEHCMISDTGIDSEHGRIHYPLAWSKARLETVDNASNSSSGRAMMITRPFRNAPQKTGTAIDRNNSNASDRWGSETVNYGNDGGFSTGNKERDDVMSRARAVLMAHQEDEPATAVPRRTASDYDDPMDREIGMPKKKPLDHDLLEDGVAPLGGQWPKASETADRVSVRDMVQDPMNHMHEIHDEATKRLQQNDYVEALRLFEVVLQCQKRRHGPLHADVASSLHNVGIAQLRAQNHAEALKAFEEAARVRKGSLGREHPQVAVSLVKVGITLLLLHRFEEALWSFREALSVRKHALGPLHPSTARIYNNIGCVHVEFNEYREARRAFEAALDIQRNALCHDMDSGPLMFGTATTLCNLGYLYRYRDMYAKAALVLKEAVDLQENVLGRSHSTVLSTLDNLADSCANSGQASDALKYYKMILERFQVGGRSGSKKVLRAEAVLLYKMSRVHRQRNDRESQLDTLKLALRSIRSYSDASVSNKTDTLERRIQYDIRACREELETTDLKWI